MPTNPNMSLMVQNSQFSWQPVQQWMPMDSQHLYSFNVQPDPGMFTPIQVPFPFAAAIAMTHESHQMPFPFPAAIAIIHETHQVPFPAAIAMTHGTHQETCFSNCVWELSRDAAGSRQVQKAIDRASNDAERAAIASQLRGHVWQALECWNANHVLQKCISSLRPQAAQFVIDEIMSRGPGSGAYAAQHRFGCRVVERLLEHCAPEQVGPLVDDLLENGSQLCSDQYGNFVVQHVLEFGCDDHKHRMSQIVTKQIASIQGDYHGCAVVSSALNHSLPEDKILIARAVLGRRGLLVSMARQRHGHDAVMILLNLVERKERADAERQLRASVAQLQKSRYGRIMAKYIQP